VAKRRRRRARAVEVPPEVEMLERMRERRLNPAARMVGIVRMLTRRLDPDGDQLAELTGYADISPLLLMLRLNGFGELADVPVGRPRGAEKAANRLVEEYKAQWEKIYRGRCATNGKDRSRALRLVREIGYGEASRRLRRFMSSRDRWLTQRTHPFAVFASTSNRYAEVDSGKETEAGIASGPDFEAEVERFEKGKRGSGE